MEYEVYGPFESSRDAATLVDNLGLKGLKVENITVFANADRRKEIKEKANVKVEDDADHRGKRSMLKKMKQMLNNVPDSDESTSMCDKMQKFGLTEEQAQRYTEEVKDGLILVVAIPEVRMGQDPNPKDTNLAESAVPPKGE